MISAGITAVALIEISPKIVVAPIVLGVASAMAVGAPTVEVATIVLGLDVAEAMIWGIPILAVALIAPDAVAV
jgi:hypothetical protein